MAWQPNAQGLAQILALLNNSKTGNTQVQRQTQEQLEQLNRNVPDFNNYMAHILTLKSEKDDIRQVAGLILKNNLKQAYSQLPVDAQRHIQQCLITSLQEPVRTVRSTAGSVITTIVRYAGFASWPGLLQGLVGILDTPSESTAHGAMSAISQICEDNIEQIDTDEAGRPLGFLIPKLIQFFAHPNEDVRKAALSTMIFFIQSDPLPNAMLANMQGFLNGIFTLANDQNKYIKKHVCQAFVYLLDKPEYIKNVISDVIRYMLHCTQHEDEDVALEACEFWSTIADSEQCAPFLPVLKEFLPGLVPVLLNGMVYSKVDRIILGEEDESDEHVADRPEDIAPSKYFHSAKVHSFHDPNAAPSSFASEPQPRQEEEEEDYDDFDDELDEVSNWNLRKSSASSLDILSGRYPDDILPTLLPLIQQKIQPQNSWEIRESAVLAIGAIADGCYNGMVHHLPALVPYLIQLLNDQKSLVRSITCWTLSRYSKWIVEQPVQQYLEPLIMNLLNRILDTNKRVQEAACSAFATLEEEAHQRLIPYLDPILDTMVRAFQKYQAKNLLILYDAIGTLADSVSEALNKPNYINKLMPPLINKWNQLDDADRNLFPLLECLTSIAGALGVGFESFALPVFQRCTRLIENTIMATAIAESSNEDAPDREFIVCSLDLLSGLAEGLGPRFEALCAGSNILQLVFTCMTDRAPDVRQSSFALVGDLAKACINTIRPVLSQFIPILVENLLPALISVCNNASWALGEIAVKIGNDINPYVDSILARIIPIMNSMELNRGLLENTAITIGRLGLVCPEKVAPLMPEFIKHWCLSLKNIRNDIEKEHAFKGLCKMISVNPQGVMQHFPFVCEAIVSWTEPNPELKQQFAAILHGFKGSLQPDAWANYFGKFPQPLKESLTRIYGL